MKKTTTLLLTVALVVASFFIGYSLDQSDSETVQSQIDEMQEQSNQLEVENTQLSEQLSELQEQYSQLQIKNDMLSVQVSALQKERDGQEETSEMQDGLLRICPDEWHDNRMPCGCLDGDCSYCDNLLREWYILDGERKELDEFDNGWVEQNCDIEPLISY